VGEFLSLLGAFRSSPALGGGSAENAVALTVAAGVGMIFGAIYILYMAGRVVFGPVKYPEEEHGHGHHDVKDLNFREIVTLLPLAVSCLWLGMLPGTMLRTLEDPIEKLTAPTMRILSIPVAGGHEGGGKDAAPMVDSVSLNSEGFSMASDLKTDTRVAHTGVEVGAQR
jgi:NADH-quinone oxidoreductase subunit M